MRKTVHCQHNSWNEDQTSYVFLTGAPDGFCEHRKDGTYQDPYDKTKFFSCVHGDATECQTCPDKLIYVQACGQCLRKYIRKFDLF